MKSDFPERTFQFAQRVFDVSEHWLTTVFPRPTAQVAGVATGEVTGEVGRLLAIVEGELKRTEIQERLGLRHEDHFREAYLVPALDLDLIEMTIPDKPRSSKQKYRLTAKGKALVSQLEEAKE